MKVNLSACLPSEFGDVKALGLTADELKEAILIRRKAIRYHRDQKGDDRCHLDDLAVWVLAVLDFEIWVRLPENMMSLCIEFYKYRRCDQADPVPKDAILNPDLWDNDLEVMTKNELVAELCKIQMAILTHYFMLKGKHRSYHDDRRLYAVLPEKMPVDFRLPSKKTFLGEGLAPHAGCPSYIRSHENCAGTVEHPCNLLAWGPCPYALTTKEPEVKK